MREHYRVERKYLRQRQKNRQKRFFLCLICVLSIPFVIWNVCHSFSSYPWLTPDSDFYRPDKLPYRYEINNKSLKLFPDGEEDRPLRQKLEIEISKYPATVQPYMFYLNLQDYSYVSIKGEQSVSAASVIKLPILLEYLRDIDQGYITQHTHLIYEDFHQAQGSGSLQYQPIGQPIIAQDIAKDMIQTSDNSCTNILIHHLGGSSDLNKLFNEMGLEQTYIANWLPDLGGTNKISMKDMTLVLYNLIQTDYLSKESRSLAYNILKGTHNRRLLAALLPKDAVLLHKTGDIGTSLGNSGLIIMPDGQRYILAIQVERPFNNYIAKEMIQNISKVIYDNLQNQHELQDDTITKQI